MEIPMIIKTKNIAKKIKILSIFFYKKIIAMNFYYLYDLFLVKNTVLRLAKERNFAINTDPDLAVLSEYADFRKKYDSLSVDEVKSKLTCEFTRVKPPVGVLTLKGVKPAKSPTDDNIYIMFAIQDPNTKSTGLAVIKDFIERISDYKSAILIVDNDLSTEAKSLIDLHQKQKVKKIQIFFTTELLFCVIDHIDTPKHVLMSEKEKKEFKQDFKITDYKNMPYIKSSDPVVKFYGWEAGNIVKIYRNDYYLDILTPETISYRYIVNAWFR